MIGGSIITHDCIRFDYCIEASLESMLGICDLVSIVDADSTDGTREFIKDHPECGKRIILTSANWKPVQHEPGKWLADLSNLAREKLPKGCYHLALQADEVLHHGDFGQIRAWHDSRELVRVKRLNFWKDHKHLCPFDKWCSQHPIRLAPVEIEYIGDAESLMPNHNRPAFFTNIRVFHYGAIRSLPQLIEKSKLMHTAYFGRYDPVLDAAEQRGREAFCDASFGSVPSESQLTEYTGNHPLFATKWLKKHGYE